MESVLRVLMYGLCLCGHFLKTDLLKNEQLDLLGTFSGGFLKISYYCMLFIFYGLVFLEITRFMFYGW